ncbi:universal stress protein [Flavobacteriaceae bacterium SZ-1-7]|uniref:universal stress protein n=1 Tax=Tamlana sedimenti TaxID=3134126 RepID=UPI00312801BD
MRKILIPTDFSVNAMNAINYAVSLFKYDVSEFFIMHAYQDMAYAYETSSSNKTVQNVAEVAKKAAKKKLENTLEKIQTISPNPRHTYNMILANNTLLDEAHKIVEKENIDIIVMGTKGETNNKKLTFGSHTLQVLKYVDCPVLAVPENYRYTQPKKILFPTDYMIPYKRRELKLVCEMLSSFRSKIDVLYLSKTQTLSKRQEDNQNFLKEELCKNKLNFNVENSHDIVGSIYRYVKENKIDMLVMVNSKHTFSDNILFQSTIDELGLHLDIPFLALQNIERN